MKIVVRMIHFSMFGIGVPKLISKGTCNQVIVGLLVTGYGYANFSLLSIGREIFKWIALKSNSAFVIFGVVGLVSFTAITPRTDSLYDNVSLIGCLIIGILGVATIKLLKLPRLM